MSTYKTPAGKSVSTFVVPNTGHYAIKLDQGGSLPERLWGLFTSEALADRAIEMYLLTFKANKKDDNGD